MYGKPNYEQNRETFAELKKIMSGQSSAIFSFGCGIGLDSLAVKESFGENVVYHAIDEYKWAIADTSNYKNFEPKLPKRFMKFKDGISLLHMTPKSVVICFFHSLYSIKKTTDLKEELLSALIAKNNFYFVCNFTINNHFGPTLNERDFIDDLVAELSKIFAIKQFDILNDRGIIIQGKRK